MQVDDPPAETEADAGPFFFGGEEGDKNLVKDLWWDPTAIVFHLYQNRFIHTLCGQ